MIYTLTPVSYSVIFGLKIPLTIHSVRRSYLILSVFFFLQTAGKEKTNLIKSTVNIVRNQGVLALYNGLSASLLRQLTYSTTRFAIYDVSTCFIYGLILRLM